MDKLKADRIKPFMNFSNILNYIIIFIVFSEAFTLQIRPILGVYWNSYFKIYHMVLAIFLLFMILKHGLISKQIYFNKTFLFLFSIVVYFSIYNLLLGNTAFLPLLPQLAAIFAHSLAFYLFVKLNKMDVRKLFSIYLNIAFVVAVIGLIQFAGYKILLIFSQFVYAKAITADTLARIQHYLTPFFDFAWFIPSKDNACWRLTFSHSSLRVNSIMAEPFSLCLALMPAFFTALVSFVKNSFKFLSKMRGLIIIISFILTFSLTGYLGIFFAILLLIYNCVKPKYVILCVLITILFAVLSYNLNPEIQFRVKTLKRSYYILMGSETGGVIPGRPAPSGQSSYTFMRNALVAFDVLRDNFAFGHGIGSHELSFNRYAEKTSLRKPAGMSILNATDAGSLFLRLLSETGLFGLSIFFIFIFRCYVKKSADSTNYLWIISNAIFVLFFIRLLRQGSYVSEGFFFFFWLYYFAKKINHENTH